MELRRRNAAKASRAGVTVEWTNDYQDFWAVLDDNLMQRYGVHPVHSMDEINLLADRFPDNILLCRASLNGITVAGVVLFVCGGTVHVQYISASPEGKRVGALDAIFSYLISYYSDKKKFFDFGKSTEDMGAISTRDLSSRRRDSEDVAFAMTHTNGDYKVLQNSEVGKVDGS